MKKTAHNRVTPPPPLWNAFAIDPASSLPMQEQIAQHLREAVLRGHLRPGARLPSTRLFAAELGVSRQTVVLAYERLAAEGYAQGRRGSGVYVPEVLPEDLALDAAQLAKPASRAKPVVPAKPGSSSSPVEAAGTATPCQSAKDVANVASAANAAGAANATSVANATDTTGLEDAKDAANPANAASAADTTNAADATTIPNTANAPDTPNAPTAALSTRGHRLLHLPITPVRRDLGLLAPGIPALDAFPHEIWARLCARFWRARPCAEQLGYADAAGYRPLRAAIADHLGATRGVACQADDVVITSGAQHAIDLAVRVLTDAQDAAWVENPGFVAGRSVLDAALARVVPVPVDAEGLNVEVGIQRTAHARLALVTPTHQYPLGVTMSLRRRLALLDWAERERAWIIEDDCDGDYRYAGRPLQPLRALGGLGRPAATNRVIYVGTFAKVLAPGLRIGFLVAPPGLADAFAHARALTDRQSATPMQSVLADFIGEGHFATHLRRMRVLYAQRRDALVAALERHCADVLDWGATPGAGLHLVARLRGARTPDADLTVWQTATALGLQTPPLSPHYRGDGDTEAGLVIGFGATLAGNMRDAVRRLRRAIDDAKTG